MMAQKTPQTATNTSPNTIKIGFDIFAFFFSPGAFAGEVPGFAVPLKAKVLPSLSGLAGVLDNACSAGVGGVI